MHYDMIGLQDVFTLILQLPRPQPHPWLDCMVRPLSNVWYCPPTIIVLLVIQTPDLNTLRPIALTMSEKADLELQAEPSIPITPLDRKDASQQPVMRNSSHPII